MIDKIKEKIIKENYRITKEDALALFDQPLEELAKAANEIRLACAPKTTSVCSIISARQGKCGENCRYCAQSAHWKTSCTSHPMIKPEDAIPQCKKAIENKVSRLSLVTSGVGLKGQEFDQALECYKEILKTTDGKLLLCASHGIISYEQMVQLKEAGVVRYHHNVETSRNYFSKICTTHTYEDRIETIRNAKKAGLEICSGGIIGMGETIEDRIDLAMTICDLEVQSVPVNILNPIPGTPLENIEKISKEEALKTIAVFRFIMPSQFIRCAAGRKSLGQNGRDAFLSGANALISGDFLTVEGSTNKEDLEMLEELGLGIEEF